jgi:hypothetical protein
MAEEVIKSLRTPEQAYHNLASKFKNFSEDTAPLLSSYISTDGIVEYGTYTKPDDDKPEPQTQQMPDYMTYANTEIWRFNRLDDIDDIKTARHEGIVLHDIMAGIRHTADVTRAVRRSVMRGYLDPAKSDATIELLTKAITGPNVKRWFEGYKKVLIERPIANVPPTNNRAGHSRPDRIVWLQDGSIEIIDYKFGDERSSYTVQVSEYIDHVAECFPGSEVRGYLWHPLTGEMRLVTRKNEQKKVNNRAKN